jgi:ABC-2 type transport system ATP-binding protein
MMDKIVIKVQGLTKDYGYGRGIFGIDLEVRKGEIFGFIGTNGSGKTTTIRNMMGFLKPDSGKSALKGLDSWAESASIMRHVSYVPGEIAFPPLATGTEFLKSQADYLGVKDFTYMNHVIGLLQLDPSASLKRMSKGMKQKTAIVAALMGEKDLLILDEPTTGLDPLMRGVFLDLIREEKEKGHTVFMSSQLFEEVEEVCDRVAMIKDGRLVDTVSLYDLRHPSEKHFAIEFSDAEELEKFKAKWTCTFVPGADTYCEVKLPITELNRLICLLKDRSVVNFEERKISLQQIFLNTYKKGDIQNGRK